MPQFKIRSLLVFTATVAATLAVCVAIPSAWHVERSGELTIAYSRPTAGEATVRFLLLFPTVIISQIAIRSLWHDLTRSG